MHEIHDEQFHTKIEIALNFMHEIPLKINRTKKKFTKKLKSSSILYNRLNFIKETLQNERHQKIQFKSERKKDK